MNRGINGILSQNGASGAEKFYGKCRIYGRLGGCDKSTTVSVTVKDATKPEISTTELTSLKTIVLTFTEDVKEAETFAVTLNDEALPEGITASVEGKTLTITNANEFASGDYKIAFTGLTDLAGNDFAEGKNTTTVTVDAESYKAEEAVKAYEDAEVTNYLSYAKAEELKEAAEDAVKKVTDADAKKTFTDRITEKDTAVAEIVDPKVKAVNEAASQAALLTALNDFFDDADQANIVEYEKAVKNGNGKLSADDIQNKVVYEINFMTKFDDAVKVGDATANSSANVTETSTTVNEFKLLATLNYGQEKGLLEGVVESRLSAYVTSAKKFYKDLADGVTGPTVGVAGTNYATSSAHVQSLLINSSVADILTAAGTAYKAAVADPAGTDKIADAEAITSKVPQDIVVTATLESVSGLKAGDNAYEAYAKGIADLKRVKAVLDVLAAENSENTVSQADLLKALKEQGFERVVDDYVTSYINGISNDGTGTGKVTTYNAGDVKKTKLLKSNSASGDENITVEAIQKKIDIVNDVKADIAVQTVKNTPTAENVKAAQEALALILEDHPATETVSLRTVKADLQEYLDNAAAGVEVKAALDKIEAWTASTSVAEIKKDLKALSDAEAVKTNPGFDYSIVDDTNETFLKNVRELLVETDPTSASDVKSAVQKAAIYTIAGKDTSPSITGWTNDSVTPANKVKADLLTLEKSTSKETVSANKFSMDIVDTSDRALEQIRKQIVTDNSTAGTTDTVAKLTDEIKLAAVKGIEALESGNPTSEQIKADFTTLQKATSKETVSSNKFSMDIVATSNSSLNAIVTELKNNTAFTATSTSSSLDLNTDVTAIITKIKAAAISSVNAWTSAAKDTGSTTTDIQRVKEDLQAVSKSLSTDPTPDFTYDSVDEKYLSAIRDTVVAYTYNGGSSQTISAVNITTQVQKAYFNALEELESGTTEQITEVLTTIGKLDGFDVKTARPELYSLYKEAKAFDSSSNGNNSNATTLQSIISEQNRLYDVNTALENKDAAAMKKALATIAIDYSEDETTIGSGKLGDYAKVYINTSDAQKNEIVSLFLDDSVFTTNGYAGASRTVINGKYVKSAAVTTGSLDGVLKDVIAIYTNVYEAKASGTSVIQTVNDACDGNNGTGSPVAITNNGVKTALDGVKYEKFDKLDKAMKLLVAEKFKDAYPTVTDSDGNTNPKNDHFTTLAEIKTAIDTAIEAATTAD